VDPQLPEFHVELPDGRRLQVTTEGDPDGPVLIIHHGTPGGAVFHPGWIESAHAVGLRIVMYARAGYGTSSRHPGRTVADAAADTAAVADALGADRFLTWGMSGGGPHALACAAKLPDRVVATATLAGVAPFDAEGLDFLADMGEGNIAEFGLVLSEGEDGLRPVAAQELAGMSRATVDELVEQMTPHLSAVDAQELRDGFSHTMLAMVRDGARLGPDGLIDDDLAFVKPWGFDLATIGTPVLLRQGRQDLMVPLGHGEWLAAHIPGVDARFVESDGHLTPVTSGIGEVHRWLRARWDAAGAR
jgi:pimeloyl-ACP methyl ester carboxylesterase